MLVRTFASAVAGIDAVTVTIEVNVSQGVRFFLVGLPDIAVKESQQRIESALRSLGFHWPGKQVVINMAPADIRKEGSAYDLPLAVGILAADGKIAKDGPELFPLSQNLAKIQQWLSQQAQQQQMWIVAGSIPCATRPDGTPVADNKVRASCLIYSPQGQLFGRYDKIHLFDANVADQQASYQESATFEAGSEVVIVETPFAKIGISICYDLRFPLLYQALRDKGAEIIVVPAAFTALTGEAHWQVLLRARAIETQCFVIGAGQSGWHSATRQTWGHSQVIDPWGKVLAEQQQTGSGLIVAVCDLSELHLIRQQMPILRHRRLF